MTRVLSKSLVRRLKHQMAPDVLAQFLASTVDGDILQAALDIVADRSEAAADRSREEQEG